LEQKITNYSYVDDDQTLLLREIEEVLQNIQIIDAIERFYHAKNKETKKSIMC